MWHMKSTDLLALQHSWPLFEARERLRRVALMSGPKADPVTNTAFAFARARPPGLPAPGDWSCDLADESLHWSPAVYALFGLPIDSPLQRRRVVTLYVPQFRQTMEHLRDYVIRHRRGFTMDAQIRRPDGEHRWMRLCAMPVLSAGKVTHLFGVKQDVTHEYDGPAQ